MLIVIIVIVLIAGFLFYVNTRSDDFSYSRSSKIKAAAEKIFPHINDFNKWIEWSPWAKIDPSMKVTITGPGSGVGSVYHWAGNGKAGEGIMNLVENKVPTMVKIDIQFVKPFPANNQVLFTLIPLGDETEVTWKMSGKRPFIIKLMGVFLNMENLMGKDFEKGLASLKGIAEK